MRRKIAALANLQTFANCPTRSRGSRTPPSDQVSFFSFSSLAQDVETSPSGSRRYFPKAERPLASSPTSSVCELFLVPSAPSRENYLWVSLVAKPNIRRLAIIMKSLLLMMTLTSFLSPPSVFATSGFHKLGHFCEHNPSCPKT